MTTEATEPTANDWHNVIVAIAQWVAINNEAGENDFMFGSLQRTSEWIWETKIEPAWKEQ